MILTTVRRSLPRIDDTSGIAAALIGGAMLLLVALVFLGVISHTLFLNGLSRAMLLFVIASGLTLVFGLMGVVNMAHGAFYALGAYAAVTMMGFSDSFWLALLVAPFIVAFIGVLVEYTAIRPLYGQNPVYGLLLTFGLAIVIEESITGVFGSNTRNLRAPELLAGIYELPFGIYPRYRLFVIVVGLVVLAMMWYVFQRTRIGIIIRAGTFDSEMTEVLGINTRRVFTGVFAFGVALAALAGIIAGPLFSVSPSMGIDVVIDAFIVVVIGGLGSIRGSFVGALLVGFAQAFGAFYIDQYIAFIIFALMIVILLARPQGLFGQPGIFEH